MHPGGNHAPRETGGHRIAAKLKVIAHGNPLTCEVNALRTMMLGGGASLFGPALDFGVLVAVTMLMVLIAGRLYPRAVT